MGGLSQFQPVALCSSWRVRGGGCLHFEDDAGTMLRPSAHSLVDVANDQFGFFSAASHAGDAGGEDVPSRIDRLESNMVEIKGLLEQFLKQGERPPVLNKPRKPGASPKDRVSLGGLDPGVLASARQAGVPEDQLQKFAALINKAPQMGDVPKRRNKSRAVLSESEEEDEEEEVQEADDSSPTSAVEKAVVQLTKLVSNMNRKKKSASGIESIFEKMEGAHQEASSSSHSSSRSKAASFQKLKTALTEKPQWIYQSIEECLEEDFSQLRSAPGAAALGVTAWSIEADWGTILRQ